MRCLAGGYDTAVTNDIVKQANALLVLLPRDRAADNEKFRELLTTIKEEYPQAHRKLIFGNNLCSYDKNKGAILDANTDLIRRIFGDDFDIVSYDALLAQYAQLKIAYDAGMLAPDVEKSFIEDYRRWCSENDETPTEDFEEAWKEKMLPYFPRSIEQPEIVEKANKKSKKEELIKTVSDFVRTNKAHSIIFAEGVDKLSKQLNDIRSRINTAYVEPYLVGQKKLQEDWVEREGLANAFDREFTRYAVEFFLKKNTKLNVQKSLLDEIVSDEYGRVFPLSSRKELAREISNSIVSNIVTILKFKGNKEKTKEYITKLVNECVMDYVKRAMVTWNNQLSDRYSVINAKSSEFYTKIKEEANFIWATKFSHDTVMAGMRTRYVNVPERFCDFVTTSSDCENIDITVSKVQLKELKEFISKELDDLSGMYGEAFRTNLGVTLLLSTLVTTIAASVSTTVFGIVKLIVAALYEPTCLVILSCIAIGVGVIAVCSKAAISKLKDFIARMLTPKIEKSLQSSELNNALKQAVSNQLKNILFASFALMRVDLKNLIKDKDKALSSFDKPDSLEDSCYKASYIIDSCNKQIGIFNDFVSDVNR